MVQRKKKPSGAQGKRLRKQKEAPYNSYKHPDVFNILTEVFIEIPGALLGDGLSAHLRPGSTRDNFTSNETGRVTIHKSI